jgi:two-component system cell cycle sensor histidine kinase/response regulator CckA
MRTLSGMHRDIHDAKRSVYEFAFETSRDPTFVLDTRGRILQRNRAARALPEEWLGRLFPAVSGAAVSAAPEVDRFHRELASRGCAHAETVIGRSTIALDGRAHNAQRIVTVDDISDCCARETERRTVRRMESIGHLTASLAHDFNNLLTPILSLSGCLEAELPDGAARTMTREIHVAAERALALVRQTLRMVRREPRGVEPVSVDAVLSDLRTLIERVVGGEVGVELALGANACVVNVDRERLEHAVLNLAANARDAMPSGGRLTLRTAMVTFAAGQSGEIEGSMAGAYVALRVSDSGIGMTSEVRERIFERFFTTKGADRGTGLGLFAVKSFVADSGGCVALHSEPSRGTTFALYLPCAALDAMPSNLTR